MTSETQSQTQKIENKEITPQTTQLPIEELVKRQGEALGKVIGYLRAKDMKEKQTFEERTRELEVRKKWRDEAQIVQKEYQKGAMSRRNWWGTLSYVSLLGLLGALPGIGALPVIGGSLGFIGSFFGVLSANMGFAYTMIGAQIIKQTSLWQNLEKKLLDWWDKGDKNYWNFEKVKAQNPDDPRNQKVKEDLVKFENGANQADANQQAAVQRAMALQRQALENGQQVRPVEKPTVALGGPVPEGVQKQQIPPEVMQLIEKARAAQQKA